MSVGRNLINKSAVVMVYLVSLALMVAAAEDEEKSAGALVPEIARGQGENCVEDTDFMRRNHMTLLKHQRDKTVRQGIRTRRHSLKQCVTCHAVPGPDGIALTVSSPKHFCRSCHDYAAVKIDCFQCHASRPVAEPVPADHDKLMAGAE